MSEKPTPESTEPTSAVPAPGASVPTDGSVSDGGSPPPAPAGFFTRLGWLLFAPGKLGEELQARPTLFWPAALGMVLTMASILLIPTEVMMEAMPTQSLPSGEEGAALGENAMAFIRLAQAGGLLVFWWVMLAVTSGIYSVIFAFILGDEGRYRQYFAVAAWSSIIAGMAALILTPLRIAARNPQLTLSPGTFLGTVMEEGYLLRVANGFDFFAIWSWVVAGILISKIDRRRSAGSAILVVGLVYAAFIFGISFFDFGG